VDQGVQEERGQGVVCWSVLRVREEEEWTSQVQQRTVAKDEWVKNH
jgi:hypothetical protein